MMPRYCLPCPRASMAAKNSFLSWISFTTAQRGGAVNAQGRSAQSPSHAWSLRDTSGICLSSHVALVSPISSTHSHTHTHTVAHVHQTGPAQELGLLAARGEPFSVPPCPSQWQRYFGVFVSLSPDLLWGPETILLMCRARPVPMFPSAVCTAGVWAMKSGPLQIPHFFGCS